MVGNGVGFLFAVTVLTISVVSFPLLLDRDVGAAVALLTSIKAVFEESAYYVRLGIDRRGAAAHRLASSVSWSHHRNAGSRPRHLASLSKVVDAEASPRPTLPPPPTSGATPRTSRRRYFLGALIRCGPKRR